MAYVHFKVGGNVPHGILTNALFNMLELTTVTAALSIAMKALIVLGGIV